MVVSEELLDAKRSLEVFLERLGEEQRRDALVSCAAESVSVTFWHHLLPPRPLFGCYRSPLVWKPMRCFPREARKMGRA